MKNDKDFDRWFRRLDTDSKRYWIKLAYNMANIERERKIGIKKYNGDDE